MYLQISFALRHSARTLCSSHTLNRPLQWTSEFEWWRQSEVYIPKPEHCVHGEDALTVFSLRCILVFEILLYIEHIAKSDTVLLLGCFKGG